MLKYQETIWSGLYPGNKHTHACLRPAVKAAENALELADRHRRRTVWRMDGGAGSEKQFRWLLGRGCHVMAKGMSNRRAYALAQKVGRWDEWGDCQLAEVPSPVDYGRPVRIFVKRKWKHGQWRHSYFISTLTLPSKRHFIAYYNQRGAAEVEQFREDKQGLSLDVRRKSSFTGQYGYILLTDLAHNLLADFRHRALQDTRFANYGFKRIVRDLLNVPGRLWFIGNQLKRVELLTQNQNAKDLIICLERYCLSE